MAEKEARNARPEVSAGMEAARARGVRLGRPTIDVLPPSAARAAELRESGNSYASIATILNTEGMTAPRGGPWQKSSVVYILRRWDEAQEPS